MPLFNCGFTGTPNFCFGLSDAGARDWLVCWSLTSALPGDPGFEVGLEATRNEPANDAEPEPGVTLTGTIQR